MKPQKFRNYFISDSFDKALAIDPDFELWRSTGSWIIYYNQGGIPSRMVGKGN